MQQDTIYILIKNLKDRKSLSVKEKIDQIVQLPSHVVFIGETGVGKDFWAKYLYVHGRYPHFINLHCGDIPENLLESEWFGYRKGAFTGAERDYDGKWKLAQGGILFINQIDLLSLNLQARLLRIIERKRFYPLGSNQEESINARFIFSVDSTIEEKIKKGLFRSDLYFRLSPIAIAIPPVRERKNDIMPLIHYFAQKNGLSLNLGAKAIETLQNYPWPGNIREIENFISNASIAKNELNDGDVQLLIKSPAILMDTIKNQELSLEEMEKEYIRTLLNKYHNKTKVAKILKISRKTLYNKLNTHEKD